MTDLDHPSCEPVRDIYLSEIFSGIQGEGLYVGCRQVFVRLAGCNLRCAYCDQPESLELRPGTCRVEMAPGCRDWKYVESPVSINEATVWTHGLMVSAPHHSITITGGEPLMQSGRLAPMVSALKARDHRIHLETSGVLHRGLERVVDNIDAISMDIKIDSADRQAVDLRLHERFLTVALEATRPPQVYCKMVVAASTTVEEITEALDMVAHLDPGIEIFLQPVTPFGAVTGGPAPGHMLALQAAAMRVIPSVRVVPQTHRMTGQL